MKKRWIIYGVIGIVLGGIGIIRYSYRNPSSLALPRDLSYVQTGDIILSVGYSFKSELVKSLEKASVDSTDYSHIGLFLRTEDSLSIVHMSIDDNCIKKENLSQFIVNNKVLKYDVYRIEKTILHEEKLRVFMDSLLNAGKTFDHTFNIKDDDSFYCTEFVYNAFKQAGAARLEEITYNQYLYPNDFVSSGLFVKL
jgi:hypothetical protein